MSDPRAATTPMWANDEGMEIEHAPCTIVSMWLPQHAWFDVIIEMEDGTRYPASANEIALANPRSPKDMAWLKYTQARTKATDAIAEELEALAEYSEL